MKYFKGRIAHFIERYHPLFSALVVGWILFSERFSDNKLFYSKFTTISYGTTIVKDNVVLEHHHKGWNDFYFTFFVVNVITVIRFLYCNLVLKPITRKLGFKQGLILKFVDAGWFSLYYLIATAWGIYVYSDDAWWFNTAEFWKGYPQNLDFEMKQYYLISLAFWLQCLLSFIFEVPRKDDKEYFFHHVLTIGLIVSSFYFNYFRVGAAILVEQNLGDVIYYHCKLLKYANLETLSNIGWVLFAITFFLTRHVIFGFILKSIWFEVPYYIVENVWDDERGYYYADWLYVAFSVGVAALQALMMFWFSMILKVAWSFIKGGEISDTTDVSDDELEEDPKGEGKKEN